MAGLAHQPQVGERRPCVAVVDEREGATAERRATAGRIDAEGAAATRQAYHHAVRVWGANGPDSRFVLSAAAARARMPAVTPEIARAHVLFRLGQHLLRRGRTDEAERHLAEASRLHPESWAIWRQAAGKNATGLAAGPDFWERVRAHGDRPYYPPPDMPGLP